MSNSSDVKRKGTPCPVCQGSGKDPDGVWEELDGCKLDFCRACDGTGTDHSKPPCLECGAMTPEGGGQEVRVRR